MSTLKVGDAIRVYGFDAQDAGKVLRRSVTGILPEDGGLIETDAGEVVHPKQCRLLRKRERRVIWVHYPASDALPTAFGSLAALAEAHGKDVIDYARCFREVLPRRKA